MIVQPDYLTVRPILDMSSGNLAMFAAIRRASSLLSNFASDLCRAYPLV
jgi:hypothetical protein